MVNEIYFRGPHPWQFTTCVHSICPVVGAEGTFVSEMKGTYTDFDGYYSKDQPLL